MDDLVTLIRGIVREEIKAYNSSNKSAGKVNAENFAIACDAIKYLNKVHKLDFKCSDYNLKVISKSIDDGGYDINNFKQVVDASIGMTDTHKLRPAKIFSRASMAKFNFSSNNSKIYLPEYDF